MEKRERRGDRMTVKIGNRIIFLDIDTIDWIEADGNYMCVHRGDQAYTLRRTLASVEKRLDPDRFIRVNRSVIVNRDRVKELRSGRWDYEVVLDNDRKWIWGRRYHRNLSRLLADGQAHQPVQKNSR